MMRICNCAALENVEHKVHNLVRKCFQRIKHVIPFTNKREAE